MTAGTAIFHERLWSRLRWIVWGGAGALLALPFVAMQLKAEGVDWNLFDFVLMGTLFGLCGAAYEIAVRVARSNVFVLGAGLATATAFFTTFINLAVGIVGEPQEYANAMFYGVVALALVAICFTQLKPPRMAIAMEITATAQALVGVIVFLTTSGHPEGWFLSAFFATTWLIAGQLFRTAARQEAAAGVAA